MFTPASDVRVAPAPGSGFPAEPVLDALRDATGVQRVPSAKLDLFVVRNFLNAATCGAVIAQIDANRRPSTVSDYNGDDAFRTSETCDLPDADPVVAAIDARIAELTGLDLRHGEQMQGQRYAVGQEFKAHTDYFEPNGADFDKFCSVAGQRTWTVMIYLNQPEAGGATRFKVIDKIMQPETGKLLAWNNLRSDGRVNPATLHHGMKVRAGTKYVITKWFRERHWPR
ncbi:prolyl 4-hydroxylase [Sphingomonas guangdongensis]|uniref:Prolyl 4-hydroxylase n=1 Tax=Sphingomonas guangdongensis TaxID=1141890 RepID=A0A285R3K2_9SPHN|nr:2OG-Fe(II) oxygenase [Sphingomonas guangdongensis]SOB86942.1 prolyl 4-hydroxylase [Sphingomonas guangdongensis]